MPELLAIKESFVMTMSALVMTLPIVIFNFGQLSTVAIITNILVSWTIPIAMFF
jgi:predicted membrane metal-binding protein